VFDIETWGWVTLLWGILAVIYAWVVSMLWTVNPQGWLFVVILSGLLWFLLRRRDMETR